MTTLCTVTGLEEVKALAGTDLGRTDWLEITQERVKPSPTPPVTTNGSTSPPPTAVC
jgi:hypothetical protein